MKKKEIKKKLKELVNDPNYEFRFQMAGWCRQANIQMRSL